MTYTHQLETDLESSIADGQLLARISIQNALRFLMEAQNYKASEIRNLVNEILSEMRAATPTLQIVAGRGWN